MSVQPKNTMINRLFRINGVGQDLPYLRRKKPPTDREDSRKAVRRLGQFSMTGRVIAGSAPPHGAGAFRTTVLARAACFFLTAATLGGCGADSVGSLMVDPARYDGLHCQGLAEQWKTLLAREKQLRNLIDKANESSGGQVIGTLAYSSDYQTVLEQEKVLKRTAEAQKCQFVATFTSDQTIR